MTITLNGTTGITTPNVSTDTSTLGPLTQALNLGSTGQIVFPATQNPSSNANTLDDYEEGTWTPRIFGLSTAGTPSGTITGSYTKIGRFVFMTGILSNYNLTGAAGIIYVDGFPFSLVGSNGGGFSVYLEGLDPVYSGTPDNNITLGLRLVGGTEAAFGPSVSNGWDSYMTASTSWTGGPGAATYGQFCIWGITST